LRFIARDPILTGILRVTKLPVQCMRPRNYRLTRAAAWPIAAPPPKPWV
jgi:hypothetical protein